jgi:Domain of unknown function (DUF1905)/Bacteriocin-protection, YdeI or OmpD-Associated
MSKMWEFDALLYKSRLGGHWVDIPYHSQEEFGTRKAVRVNAWFDGVYHRTSLAPKGDGTHWLHVRKEIREATGKFDGDTIHVKIERDLEPRTPHMPDDMKWLLENEPETKAVFNRLSPSLKKQLIDSVANAKTEETRVNNINKVFEFLYQKKKGWTT